MAHEQAEHQFKGAFAEEYVFLKEICPGVVDCARYSATELARLHRPLEQPALKVLEIGCGSGLSTRAFLDAREDVIIDGIDIAPQMLDQARQNLSDDIEKGRLSLHLEDALSYLQHAETGAYDVVISNYALHNFLETYRNQVVGEIARVLNPGGHLINGDRYGLDDPVEHLRVLQEEVKGYFQYFKPLNRWDLIQDWVIHVLSDESLDHVMRLAPSCDTFVAYGLSQPKLIYRDGINAVLVVEKPLQ